MVPAKCRISPVQSEQNDNLACPATIAAHGWWRYLHISGDGGRHRAAYLFITILTHPYRAPTGPPARPPSSPSATTPHQPLINQQVAVQPAAIARVGAFRPLGRGGSGAGRRLEARGPGTVRTPNYGSATVVGCGDGPARGVKRSPHERPVHIGPLSGSTLVIVTHTCAQANPECHPHPSPL